MFALLSTAGHIFISTWATLVQGRSAADSGHSTADGGVGVSLRIGWCGASLGEGNASQKYRRTVERRHEGDGGGRDEAARTSESDPGRRHFTVVTKVLRTGVLKCWDSTNSWVAAVAIWTSILIHTWLSHLILFA